MQLAWHYQRTSVRGDSPDMMRGLSWKHLWGLPGERLVARLLREPWLMVWFTECRKTAWYFV